VGGSKSLFLSGKANFASGANASPVNGDISFDGTNLHMQISGVDYIFTMAPGLPSVLSISPVSGSMLGGTPVTITGTNFAGATSVSIGGAAATSIVVVNPSTVTCTSPAGTVGARNVTVTTPIGTGTGTGLFTYIFDPTTLFAGGQTGGWWDPSDHTTTFQDTAGTVPANVAGQVVKRINDKSGNGNSLASSAGCTLQNSGSQWWLQFNGTSNYLTSSFGFTQPVTRISALRQITWVSSAIIYDGSITDSCVLMQLTTSPNLTMHAGVSFGEETHCTLGANHVVLEFFSGTASTLQTDNFAALTGGNAGTSGPGGFTVGCESNTFSRFANTMWFGGITIGRALTTPETNSCRTFFGAKAGLTL
jgi:hypothetical protein